MIVAGQVEAEDGPGAASDLRPDAQPQVGVGDGCVRLQRRHDGQQLYAIVQGVDPWSRSDMYLPVAAPAAEMLIDAILKIHDPRSTTASARTVR